MKNKIIKKKYVFLGDFDSINIELICNSFQILKNKTKYILIGNLNNLKKYLYKIKSDIPINEIFNPYDFDKCYNYSLNIFNIENISSQKYKNLLNQINIANYLANDSQTDLVTMPINKSLIKEKIKFIGVTEYLGKINNKKTIMLMYGEKFSVIPLTTHINPKKIHLDLNKINLKEVITRLLALIKDKRYNLNFNHIKFLCYNPHCGEKETIGNEDKIIADLIKKLKKVSGPFPADSAFQNIKKDSLYISTYHDQALIPFKLINKKGVNLTMGLNYRRLSPTHGTAKDIKYKNISDNSSYIACMKI